MVSLKESPFFLADDAVMWVEDTISGMTTREKICQLFMDPLLNMDEGLLLEFLRKYPLGGAPFRTMPVGNELGQELIAKMQQASKVPMFFAGNNEAGANGTLRGGTFGGLWLRRPRYARPGGRLSGGAHRSQRDRRRGL